MFDTLITVGFLIKNPRRYVRSNLLFSAFVAALYVKNQKHWRFLKRECAVFLMPPSHKQGNKVKKSLLSMVQVMMA